MRMWTIAFLGLPPGAGPATMSDGQPVTGVQRSGDDVLRLMVKDLGWLDILDEGLVAGGPQPSALDVGGQTYWYAGQASMSLTVSPQGQCQVSGDGNLFTVPLQPFPLLDPDDLGLLFEMVQIGLVPYPQLPPDGRPFQDVMAAAARLFAWSDNPFDLGMVVYDWTSPDFFRMDVFNYYRYTAIAGAPLDLPDIANGVWTTNWPPYVASDPTFMGSMMMQPATSLADVSAQLQNVAGSLLPVLDMLKRLTSAALVALPRTSLAAVPVLYSGQVDVSNLGETALATYFEEYPGNAGPVGTPMGEPVQTALQTFMAPGSVVTLKSFLSTTDSVADAAKYSNGFLLEVGPPAQALSWPTCAYITHLSNEASKTEYLFGPGAQFVTGSAYPAVIGGKQVLVIPLTVVAP
jgi:hypothetical protein